VAQRDPHEEMRALAQAEGVGLYVAPDGGRYIVVRHADTWRVFANVCPHRRLPLDRGGTVAVTTDRGLLVCANHGARFDPATGECVAGPCVGKRLRRIPEFEA
jgi:nitrite reductase/ring-hydroxylating ferredoxin subunit